MKPILPSLLAAAALLPVPAALAQAGGQAPAQAAPAPAAWKTFTSPEGRFSVLMPNEPKASVDPIADGPGAPGKTFLFTSAGPEGVFLAGWADYAPGFKFDDQAELTANRDNFVKGVQGKLLATRAITLNGAPGMEFDVEKTGMWTGRVRLYIIGNRPYQLMTIVPGATLDTAKAARFFDSFRLFPAR